MNDKDITKLANKLIKSLVTKEDMYGLKEEIRGLGIVLTRVEEKLDKIIRLLDEKFGRTINTLNRKSNTTLKN